MHKDHTERLEWRGGIEPEVFPCMICGKGKAKWRSLLVERDLRIKICHCGECGRMGGKEIWLMIERGGWDDWEMVRKKKTGKERFVKIKRV